MQFTVHFVHLFDFARSKPDFFFCGSRIFSSAHSFCTNGVRTFAL